MEADTNHRWDCAIGLPLHQWMKWTEIVGKNAVKSKWRKYNN
jgi:hypothetical protein